MFECTSHPILWCDSMWVSLLTEELGVHYAYMHSRNPENRGRRKQLMLFKKTLSGSQYPPEIKPLTLGKFTAPSP